MRTLGSGVMKSKPAYSTTDMTYSAVTKRSYGITSLILSPTSDDLAWALGFDNAVHRFHPNLPELTPIDPLSSPLSHPNLSVNSFFVRMSLSPCTRYLGVGSSSGAPIMFDAWSKNVGVALAGAHAPGQETANVALTMTTDDEIEAFSASDDGQIRRWRMNDFISARRRRPSPSKDEDDFYPPTDDMSLWSGVD